MDATEKIYAARELLAATKRDLQVVDEQIAALQKSRIAVAPAEDVSTEHRFAMLGATDDNDPFPATQGGRRLPGIRLGNTAQDYGWANPKRGTIRNQEDAAFVCTDIVVAIASEFDSPWIQVWEAETDLLAMDCYLRLTDGNTGRTLTAGLTTGPLDRDRGAIPFSYLSSIRPGIGSNVKNTLFSEFTIPRAGVIRAEVFNLGATPNDYDGVPRVFVSLVGFKVYGGG